jgi:hypothetical protein
MLMENEKKGTANLSYLIKEYEECFEQLRYYDTRQTDFIKYYYTLASAVIAALFALFKFLNLPDKSNAFYDSIILLAAIVFIAGILFYIGMLQNRIYFVLVARQINAIRGCLLGTDPGFINQMYTSTNLRVYRGGSLHTVEIFGVTLTSSIFGAALVFGICARLALPAPFVLSGTCFVLIVVIQVVLGISYLRKKNNRTGDDIVRAKGEGQP